MKNFFKSLGLQLIAVLAAVSGFTAVICFAGIVLSFNYEILALFIGSSLVFGIAIYVLRINKVTFVEIFSAMFFGFGPK